jgi:KilA-N domain
MNTTISPTSATARAPMTDAPEVLDAIDQTTDHPAGRPRRPATAPGRDLRPLHIGGVEIAQDEHGRYSLNDMHRAAMAAGSATESHKPGNFMQSAGVQAFIETLEASVLTAGIPAIKTEPGRYGGTFGARLVVLRYAAWIAPTFEVQVYQCFDDMTRGKAPGYRLDDHARRVRDVLGIAELAVKARGLRGAARLEGVRAVVSEIAPDLLHLVATPAPAAPVTPPPAPVADLPTLFGKPKEGADLLLNVADWFRKNAKTGFLLWALDEFNPKDAGRVAGWLRPSASGNEVFYILVNVFRSEVCKDCDHREVLRLLDGLGLVVREGRQPKRGKPDNRRFDSNAKPPLFRAGSAQVYRIKSDIMSLTT